MSYTLYVYHNSMQIRQMSHYFGLDLGCTLYVSYLYVWDELTARIVPVAWISCRLGSRPWWDELAARSAPVSVSSKLSYQLA